MSYPPTQPDYAMPISDEAWALMQHLAREHERQRERDRAGSIKAGGGWIRFGIPEGEPWTWNTLKWLVALTLIERIDTYMNALVRLTDFGWKMLADGLERTNAP